MDNRQYLEMLRQVAPIVAGEIFRPQAYVANKAKEVIDRPDAREFMNTSKDIGGLLGDMFLSAGPGAKNLLTGQGGPFDSIGVMMQDLYRRQPRLDDRTDKQKAVDEEINQLKAGGEWYF